MVVEFDWGKCYLGKQHFLSIATASSRSLPTPRTPLSTITPETFACHESGVRKPAMCAGFLLHGADHNLSVRIKSIQGDRFDDVEDGGHQLYENYRAMAIANGVSPDDPVLAQCRD
ncbi:TPA: DUF6283 family protein [Burkholderia cepacia]|nr:MULTISPECIES: DUF6283 family protein [Burkholderia]MBY4814816.1 DUF6283 family protein [Burkholderia contaminans]MBY4826518.1 DUF6283 family protein [Burkholderia contaminans]MBY4851930.1 DUF6283 family protein [Burkholderia contaminans]MBY4879000.1 DUF6283 family protein [Burkholderia contaminans]